MFLWRKRALHSFINIEKASPRLHICITEEAFSRTGPRGDTSANLIQVYIPDVMSI